MWDSQNLWALGLSLFMVGKHPPTAPCPPVSGGGLPAPVSPALSQAAKTAQVTLTEQLQDAIRTGRTTRFGPFNNATSAFSINVFSSNEQDPSLFNYHHQGAGLAKGAVASGKLNDDTIYRIGSISKLLTTYTVLMEAGDGIWLDPITKYVPELAAYEKAAKEKPDNIDSPLWSEITVGALASHLSGIAKDVNINDMSTRGVDYTKAGLPPLPKSEVPTCEANPMQKTCDRESFFKYLGPIHPTSIPFHTPQYSNTAFYLLSYVLEGITGKKYEQSFESKLKTPLNLTRTSLRTPQDLSNAIIPVNEKGGLTKETGLFGWDLGDASPAGGMYSSVSDLTRVGQSILQSKFLPPAMTRRWLKPVTFTSNVYQSIGMAWEIARLQIPVNSKKFPGPTRFVDIYTKVGELGAYNGILAVDPEHNMGFTILCAGEKGADQLIVLAEMVANVMIPAMEEAAREEAVKNFVGTYESSDLKALNSSVTISLDENNAGLRVSSWTSNSTDMVTALGGLLGIKPPSKQVMSLSLYPSGVKSAKAMRFRGVVEVLPNDVPIGGQAFSQDCASWGKSGSFIYGNVAVDDFVFEVDEKTGKATGITPRVARAPLKRKAITRVSKTAILAKHGG